jgi:hypothetical protein
MQKGQKTGDKHAESWGQVGWALGWRYPTASLLLFYVFLPSFPFFKVSLFYFLKPHFFSIL